MAETLQLGLVGLGTVGAGVYETLMRNKSLLEARAQVSYAIKRVVVRNLDRPREVQVPREILSTDWRDVVKDEAIDIIIELIGGVTDARELVIAALKAGKPVVTGNKALLAEHGSELFKLSVEKHTPLYFEASCGGGIPIIQSIQNSLVCNNVQSIVGIINGTSNYILTAMQKGKVSFADALAKAQELGFAEADPSFDVNGWDAGHKALILAMLAYGIALDPQQISVYGIERVESVDFQFAKKLGYTIKLLVVIKQHEADSSLELRVQPSFVPQDHLLAKVNGVFNAIAVKGDIVGETIFYGRGAGKNPTTSAVIGDLVMALRECKLPDYHTGFRPYSQCMKVMAAQDTQTPYYLRFRVKDKPGVIAALATIFARHEMGISATSSTQRVSVGPEGEVWNDLVFMIHECPWGVVRGALAEIAQLADIDPHPVVFRIETFTD